MQHITGNKSEKVIKSEKKRKLLSIAACKTVHNWNGNCFQMFFVVVVVSFILITTKSIHKLCMEIKKRIFNDYEKKKLW